MQPSLKTPAERRTYMSSIAPTEDEKFRKIMDSRLQTIEEKACCDGHSSSPMYVGTQRLACCAGSGSSCKIKELQFLVQERKRLGELADENRLDHSELQTQNFELKRQLAAANKEIGDLQEQNNRLENNSTHKRARPENPAFEPFSQAAKVVHIHNTTNIMNVTFIGSDTLRKNAVDLLVAACKPGGDLLGSVSRVLQANPTPENLKLLELKKVNPAAFQDAVVDNLSPLIPAVPEEFRAKVVSGLKKATTPP